MATREDRNEYQRKWMEKRRREWFDKNWWFNWDWTITSRVPDPTMEPRAILVPTPTPVVADRVSKEWAFVWSSLELVEDYEGGKYSYTYKDKMVKDNNPCWLRINDKFSVLEQQFPYARIRINEHYPTQLWCEGWIKA